MAIQEYPTMSIVPTGGYLKKLSAAMNIKVPAAVAGHPLRDANVKFFRVTSHSHDFRVVSAPVEESLMAVLTLADNPAREVVSDGRHILHPRMKRGEFMLVDNGVKTIFNMEMDFDNIHMHFQKRDLRNFAYENGLCLPRMPRMDYGISIDDIVIRSLGHCLLPAFKNPERANRLFVDHVGLALLGHIAGAYAGADIPRLVRGGLAPRQLRRAVEILVSRLDGEIPIDELARECGLSRSHFARAFKKTTGQPPHRWLMERRLERARELLLKSKLSLAEVADACGFADRSHFTRSFFAATGVLPSEWRRLRRN